MSSVSLRAGYGGFRIALTRCSAAAMIGLLATGLWSSAGAQPADFTKTAEELTPQELNQYRGGFTTAGGFEFSFGLQRITQINNEPAITQSLFSVDRVINGLTSGVAGPARQQVGVPAESPVVIQRGSDNFVAPSVLNRVAGAPRTIIQNSLDNQRISNTNIYDIRVDNLGAITRGLGASLQRGLLNQQLVDSIR